MRSWARVILVVGLSLACLPFLGASPAGAQGLNTGDSLGGYGGSMGAVGSNMSMSGPVIPYAGTFGGFMPARMEGSGGLRFQPRGGATLGSGRTLFRMSAMSGEMGSSMGSSVRSFTTLGSGGALGLGGGMGGGGGMPMSGAAGRGVMPPSFGYPFRQPPSLLLPSSSMNMSM